MVEIRGYRETDLSACRALWVELTEQHRRIYDSPGIGGDDPGSKFDEHLAKVGPTELWVAVDGGEVVGLIGLQESGDIIEIEPAVVTDSRRGEGIGRLLVDHAIAVAREREIPMLSVCPVARNAEAIRFYHEAGFRTLGYVEMFIDLSHNGAWIDGETIADREFLV